MPPAPLPPLAALIARTQPLLTARSYDAIDVAVDALLDAGLEPAWDHWLDGLQRWSPQEGTICPRRFSQTLTDRPYVVHAALRLIATAPEGCAPAARVRRTTALRLGFLPATPAPVLDLALLAGWTQVESVQVANARLRVPAEPRPDWLPSLTTLDVQGPLDAEGARLDPAGRRALADALRAALPHVRELRLR